MAIDFEAANSSRLTFPTGASGPTQGQNRGAFSIGAFIIPETITNANIVGVSTNNGGVPTTNTRASLKTSGGGAIENNTRAPDGGGQVQALGTAGALVAGAFHHIMAAIDVANDVADLFLDGTLDSSPAVAYTNAATDNTVSASGAVACEEDGASSPFWDGVLMDIMFYSVQKTREQERTIFATRGMSVPYFGLLSRWQMKETAPGTTLAATAGLVKDCGPTQMNLTAAGTTRPAGAESRVCFRRRVT